MRRFTYRRLCECKLGVRELRLPFIPLCLLLGLGEAVGHLTGLLLEVVELDRDGRFFIIEAMTPLQAELIRVLLEPSHLLHMEADVDRLSSLLIFSPEGNPVFAGEVILLQQELGDVIVTRVFVTLDQHRKHLAHVATFSLDGIVAW